MSNIRNLRWLLDRKTRLICITPHKAAQKVLRRQWPKEAFPNLSFEEASAFLKENRKPVKMPTNEDIQQGYQQEMRTVADLVSWLEKYWPMPVFGGEG